MSLEFQRSGIGSHTLRHGLLDVNSLVLPGDQQCAFGRREKNLNLFGGGGALERLAVVPGHPVSRGCRCGFDMLL